MIKISVGVFTPVRISVQCDEAVRANIGSELVIVGEQLPEYEGPYEETSSFETKVLQTKGKRMTDDILFNKMPVAIVSNPSGGRTVIIG